ncbi:hypothetical protein E2C01_054459 [Portunus trituberculatus]|uniref:Uncharacterized protein n=1 Tax=Portunus trituberculatus TaxID=210409 RepID=A0A5B7GSQ6_PORTR|nr:hypothetical protein [Portunus trituberculatus]
MGAGIREFTGKDSDFTFRDYVALCEATMTQCGIVDDVDEIHFLCSHPKAGSQPMRLMEAAIFVKPEREKDSATFREHVLTNFGKGTTRTVLTSAIAIADMVFSDHNIADLQDVQLAPYREANNFTRTLEDQGWV